MIDAPVFMFRFCLLKHPKPSIDIARLRTILGNCFGNGEHAKHWLQTTHAPPLPLQGMAREITGETSRVQTAPAHPS